jgi:vancomycin resistance protein VanJ
MIFVALFGHLFWPYRPGQVTDEMQEITVMSFNVLYSNSSYDAIVATIQAAKPDIVGLQELSPASAAAIVERLAADYPYSTLL